jgi:hypothetical protein
VEAVLILGARALLATIFVAAVYAKLRSSAARGRFVTTVEQLTKLPRPRAHGIAYAVLTCEALTIALLVLFPRAGFALAAALLVTFIAVAVRAVRIGVFTDCECFGRAGEVMGYPVIARNMLLLAAATPGLVLGPGTTGPLLAGLVGAVIGVAFVRFYDALVSRALLAYVKR